MRHLINVLFFFASFIVAVNLAWHCSSAMNFNYSSLHSLLDIDEHVKKYAKRNYEPDKRRFAEASIQQQKDIFSQIVSAINHQGKGLESIQFSVSEHNKSQAFLTDSEVLHLQDVARLVSVFNYLALVAFFIAVVCFYGLRKWSLALHSLKEISLSLVMGLTVLTAIVLAYGAKEVFYALHELIFTTNQWFFYYEESLMTTLMKAPDVFAPITVILLLWALLFYGMLLLGLHQWQKAAAEHKF